VKQRGMNVIAIILTGVPDWLQLSFATVDSYYELENVIDNSVLEYVNRIL